MSQWKNDDSAGNSVLWGVVGFNKTGNSVNRNAFFNNITPDAYVTNLTTGQFGVDTTEAAVGNGPVAQIIMSNTGSGYLNNVAITFTGGGGSSAAANGTANGSAGVYVAGANGKIITTVITNAGSSYETNPTIVFDAPANTTFNANSAVTAGPSTGLATDANSTITTAAARAFNAGDLVTYRVATGNTTISGLVSGTTYYVQHSNTTVIALSEISGGSRITLTKGLTETGHAIQGVTATGAAIVGGAKNKGVAHAGWVVRKVGTGGRAGRVQYETLVAMGSMTGDASDDSILPDS